MYGSVEKTPATATTGRRSPDPFKRFRRLSSSNSLSTDSAPTSNSSTSKPTRLQRARSTSISNISSVLGLRPRSPGPNVTQDSDSKSSRRNSVFLSSDTDYTTSPPSSPVRSRPQISGQPSPTLSKQHRQAWYQAQQKTIDLDQQRRSSHSRSGDNLFPLNVHAPNSKQETFLSADEMMAAGIHIIRRQDDNTTTPTQRTVDLLEVIDSPAATPHTQQLAFPIPKSPSKDSVQSDSSASDHVYHESSPYAASSSSDLNVEAPTISTHIQHSESSLSAPHIYPTSSDAAKQVKPPKPAKPSPEVIAALPRLQQPQDSNTGTRSASSSRIRTGSSVFESHAAPPPPPRRPADNKARLSGSAIYGPPSTASSSSSTPMTRAASAGGVVGALGQVGQIGAAMGRRGWGFVKTFQGSAASSMSRGPSSTGSGSTTGAGYQSASNSSSAASAAGVNPATRHWLAVLERPSVPTDRDAVFGAPLNEAVLLSRLSGLVATETKPVSGQLGIPDLGDDFSLDFADTSRATPRASMAGHEAKQYTRQEARHLFLPRVVVRCIESLERWGTTEEGIYRISGRSSHTTKLRTFFSNPREDLKLDEISPADLDINSVCSILKSYLRELPEPIIPQRLGNQLDNAVSKLFAAAPDLAVPEGGERARTGAAADQKAARLDPSQVEASISPLVRQLPVYNWYLLRELSDHLGHFSHPSIVAQTKMPLSNLTLVLAPTVSISLPVLQVLVQQRQAVFKNSAPHEDVQSTDARLEVGLASRLTAQASLESTAERYSDEETGSKPKRPTKPENLFGVSKLPVSSKMRASSIGLSALLQNSNPPSPNREQASGLAANSRYMPPSPSFAAEPFVRPSTSMGHFADSSSPSKLGPEFESRAAARGYNALALDEGASQRREASTAKVATPIARYYAQFRPEGIEELPVEQGLSSAEPDDGGGMHRFWADKVSATSSADSIGRPGAISALDRPRPITSSSASFFSGRSRRQDSVNEVASFKAPPGSSGVKTHSRSRESSTGSTSADTTLPSTAPLKIVKRNFTVADTGAASGPVQTLKLQKSSDLSSSASSNTVSSAGSTVDTAQSFASYLADDQKAA